MATWDAVLAEARALPGFDARAEDEFSLTFERRQVDGTQRAQRVWLRRYEAWSTAMVEIRSAFAEAGVMEPEAAMRHNLDLPLGAIARHGDVLVVVCKLPLTPLSLEGVLFAARRVSMVADVLEANRGTDRF